ncbi:AraC family transcriptional regulator [Pseudoclavibacter sp. VKM Ac-2888]|uniref:AraC family transcriptional regulator n=1 Tax=Pseudoclavibacter sp. VKM Ac-2888 TaxID=2783830 RepID=UPI00188C533A|nr:AraC family transcriptional regulator [Pseudoclavibacter sp. VKM Ac-2888]MBF4549345.1 AraC family transcriptional regulator [Pseudoclavibacter sp. VKM Ac-2888]
MPIYPDAHALGRIDVVDLADTAALSQDVTLDVEAVQAAWPDFERGFDSLQGRRMMGLVFGESGVYRLASVRLERDNANSFKLDETTIPGGAYLRLRLRGRAPGIYEQISPAFDALFALADYDTTRPHIEYYKREGEVDCLVPILPVSSE